MALAVGVLLSVLVLLFYAINDHSPATAPMASDEKQEVRQSENSQAEIKELAIPGQAVIKKDLLLKSVKEVNKKNINGGNKGSLRKQQGDKVANEHGYSKGVNKVSRAMLTYGINNKGPASEIVRPLVVSKTKPQWVYYLTELKSMDGNNIYHEWLKNGVVVSRQKLHVSGDIWRTTSRRLFSESEKGKWSVRLLDGNGQLLNERKFKVE